VTLGLLIAKFRLD